MERKRTVEFALCLSIFFGWHTGSCQSGINTLEPKVTLDVMGSPSSTNVADGIIAPRITGLQLRAKDNLYGLDQNGAVVYITTPLLQSQITPKTKNVVQKGYYNFKATSALDGEWVRIFNDYAEIKHGAVIADTFPNSSFITSTNGTENSLLIANRTFTLTQNSVVIISISLGTGALTKSDAQPINDNRTKITGITLSWQNGGGVFTNGQTFYRSSSVHTSGPYVAGSQSTVAGSFYHKGTRTFRLPAGTYSVDLRGIVLSGSGDSGTNGVRSNFGLGFDNTERFDVIVLPLPN